MAFLGDIFDSLLGGGSDAAIEAANIQAAASDKAIEESRRALQQARKDLQPFREAGQTGLDPLTQLITNPEAQRDFITQNPFFDALAGDAEQRLLSNAAARGKVGSGGTAEALQNSILLLGEDLLSNRVGQLQNLSTLGANAAAGQATASQNTGRTIADLITGQGNAQAAGLVGSQNAKNQAANNLVNTGLSIASLALSDARTKTDIRPFGYTNEGIPIYQYRYKGDTEPQVGVMAQEVEMVKPEAVKTIAGFKHVDYARLH